MFEEIWQTNKMFLFVLEHTNFKKTHDIYTLAPDVDDFRPSSRPFFDSLRFSFFCFVLFLVFFLFFVLVLFIFFFLFIFLFLLLFLFLLFFL